MGPCSLGSAACVFILCVCVCMCVCVWKKKGGGEGEGEGDYNDPEVGADDRLLAAPIAAHQLARRRVWIHELWSWPSSPRRFTCT